MGAAVAESFPGQSLENWWASRVSASTSGKPFGNPKSLPLVLMIFVRLHAFQNAQCVFGQNSEGTIQRDQVRGDCLRIDTHEAHRKAWCLLPRQIRLEQSDHALLAFPGANQQDVCLTVFESHLV